MSDYLGAVGGLLPYMILLDGGAGNLVVNGFGPGAFTAEITEVVPVPEPGQWAMMGVTALGAAGYAARRRAKANLARVASKPNSYH